MKLRIFRKTHLSPMAIFTIVSRYSSQMVLPIVMLLAAQIIFSHSPVKASQLPTNLTPQWSILTGYGASHPDWGETEVRLETVDFVIRRSSLVIDEIGSSWYKGSHSLFVELPLHFLLGEQETPMIGINFLANYTFTQFALQPYIFVGGGPVYIDAEIEGMGSDWNGNYQIGGGLSFKLDDNHSLFFEGRFHHISNGNTKDPNIPLNSTKFLIGYTF